MEQLDINIRVSEDEQQRNGTRLLNEMYPFCYECGCLENGTIEFDDEIVNCHVCNWRSDGAIRTVYKTRPTNYSC